MENSNPDKQEVQRLEAGRFAPGVSGNPSGRPKADINLRDLARSYTSEAINTLAEIANNTKAPPASRVQAACALLDRGWGKPAQYIESVQVGLSYTEFLNRLAEADMPLLDAQSE